MTEGGGFTVVFEAGAEGVGSAGGIAFFDGEPAFGEVGGFGFGVFFAGDLEVIGDDFLGVGTGGEGVLEAAEGAEGVEVDEAPFDGFEAAVFGHFTDADAEFVVAAVEDLDEGSEVALFEELIEVEGLGGAGEGEG